METESQGGSLAERAAGWPQRIKDYIEDLRSEMRRVTWPSWKQVRATTTVVIVAIFVFAAYFWVVDIAMTQFVKKIFDTFTK